MSDPRRNFRLCFFFQAEDGIRDRTVTGVQTCALPILLAIWLFSIKLGWFAESGGYDVTTTVAWSWAFVSDAFRHSVLPAVTILVTSIRSEERRVGKECRSARWWV